MKILIIIFYARLFCWLHLDIFANQSQWAAFGINSPFCQDWDKLVYNNQIWMKDCRTSINLPGRRNRLFRVKSYFTAGKFNSKLPKLKIATVKKLTNAKKMRRQQEAFTVSSIPSMYLAYRRVQRMRLLRLRLIVHWLDCSSAWTNENTVWKV